MIMQSGKYDELHQAGSDFAALVAAHDSSKDLLESAASGSGPKEIKAESSAKSSIVEAEVESDAATRSQQKTTPGRQVKEEEERATEHVASPSTSST